PGRFRYGTILVKEWALPLAVGLGGGLGAMSRYGLVMLSTRLPGAFPWGTLAVNVLGGFGIGVLFLYGQRRPEWALAIRVWAITGFLGGFTTFSAFSLETLQLWSQGAQGKAVLNVLANVVLSLAAVAAGMACARRLLA
ncbi:MAG TPA: fluoride efflux transporter CrcB, partial [Candidatus Macondimonas sp.]|nr:fluoride efflux transporter CrcB [Candidatus Macondimonas sp.]